MNRSKPMRRSYLNRGGKPLQRTELQQVSDKRRQQLPPWCRSTLNPVSGKRQRQNRVRAGAVVQLRQTGDWCARCGRTGVNTAGHERLARAHGADITRPDMLACHVCNGWFEDNPQIAAWQGWKVSRKHPTAPCIAAGVCGYGAHSLGEYCAVAA